MLEVPAENDVITTVSRVERRLRKEPKKDLPLQNINLSLNDAEFHLS